MFDKLRDKIGNILYDKLPKKITRNDLVRQDITTLTPAGNIPELLREFYAKKLSLCVIVVVIGVFLSLVMWKSDKAKTNIVDNKLARNEYGDGSSTYSLKVSDGSNEYDIEFDISERQYTKAEIEKLLDELLGVIDDEILGENESLDKIEYDMNFPSSISPYPFSIEYKTDSDFIANDGSLVNRGLASPEIVEIEMMLKYGEFEAIHSIYAMVYSKAIQPTVEERILEQLNIEELDSRYEGEVNLPDKLGDTLLTWSLKRSYTGVMCLIATPILMLAIFVLKDKDLHQKVEEREEQMRLDYPEIVSSLALLIGAGMTVPNAWKKIAYDYRRRKDEGGEVRFAYEEMLFTIYEMDSGITQAVAYERFGRRCRIPCYNKLATTVSQNIKKGAVSLPVLLKEEAREAFEDRKHMAKKQGEKVSTKLLGPMMILLIVTMAVIMVPVFMAYF
jgi:hypothetical protein